jgi:hypothetical protein
MQVFFMLNKVLKIASNILTCNSTLLCWISNEGKLSIVGINWCYSFFTFLITRSSFKANFLRRVSNLVFNIRWNIIHTGFTWLLFLIFHFVDQFLRKKPLLACVGLAKLYLFEVEVWVHFMDTLSYCERSLLIVAIWEFLFLSLFIITVSLIVKVLISLNFCLCMLGVTRVQSKQQLVRYVFVLSARTCEFSHLLQEWVVAVFYHVFVASSHLLWYFWPFLAMPTYL